MEATLVQVIVQGGALGFLILCAKWFAPRLDKLIDRHIGLVNTLEGSVKNIETNIVQQTSSLRKMEDVLPLLCKSEKK